MRRLLSIATVPILVTTATLSLQSCSDPGSNSPSSGGSASIITLADGATMAAAKGSRQRAMAEWLTAAGARGSSLDLPPGTFVSEKATLSRAGLGEAATLATLLDATADARIALVVHEHAQNVAASSLGRKRADALATFLEDRGIASDRLAIRTDRLGRSANQASLTLVAERGSWRDPIRTAAR